MSTSVSDNVSDVSDYARDSLRNPGVELNTSKERAIEAARAADAKSATDVLILEVGEVLGITEFFVITSASNLRQTKAVAEEIEDALADFDNSRPLRIEGMKDREWILLDYGDIVIHVFLAETRSYYELERLWRDVETIAWRSDATILSE